VNASGCVKVLTNFYSVPLPVGVEVQAKVYSSYVEIWHQGESVARHERCFHRQQKVLNLEAPTKKRSVRWFNTARTVAGTRALASQFRSLLGDAEATKRPAKCRRRSYGAGKRCRIDLPPY
jgi:hypothetical protein